MKSLFGLPLRPPVKAITRPAPFASKRHLGGGKQQWLLARSQVPLAERDMATRREASERAVPILQKFLRARVFHAEASASSATAIIQVLLRPPSKPRACFQRLIRRRRRPWHGQPSLTTFLKVARPPRTPQNKVCDGCARTWASQGFHWTAPS